MKYRELVIRVSDFYRIKKYDLYVARSAATSKLYIAKEVLTVYQRIYAWNDMDVHLLYANKEECTDPINSGILRALSPLKLYGYTVGINGLKKHKREDILKYVIDHDIMSGYDIINLLSFNIHNAEESANNMDVAISDWRDDIKWVESYMVHR